MVSLIFESTNILVKGSIEASSPEERHENDLPLSGLLPSSENFSPLVDFKAKSLASATPVVSPLLNEGVFPYQPNAIGAIVAAGLTMAVMAIRESGKIDLEALGYILNCSDFYVGVAGSMITSVTHRQTIRMIESALARGAGNSDILKPIFTSAVGRQLGGIINGFTYTFAVTTGFEYFSQIWKHATKNIPEAHTVSGFLKAEPIRKKQVALNLMYYFVVDTNMQKRILSSVYSHRILTFEFIATNVAMYVGAQLGNFLVARYGANTPWLKKVGPVLGSISGGLFIQCLPTSWSNAANQKLTEYKIARSQKTLAQELKQLRVGIASRFYPVESRPAVGYWVKGADLDSDIDRVLRSRDLIASMQLQLAMGGTHSSEVFNELSTTFLSVETEFRNLLKQVRDEANDPLDLEIGRWISEGKSPQEIQTLGARFPLHMSQGQYYAMLLDSAVERSHAAREESSGVIQLIQNRQLSSTELAVFGF
jgi:hypothetical protein